MARTVKAEYSAPDGYHLTMRSIRKARPAGRIVRIVAEELALDAEDRFDIDFDFFNPMIEMTA